MLTKDIEAFIFGEYHGDYILLKVSPDLIYSLKDKQFKIVSISTNQDFSETNAHFDKPVQLTTDSQPENKYMKLIIEEYIKEDGDED